MQKPLHPGLGAGGAKGATDFRGGVPSCSPYGGYDESLGCQQGCQSPAVIVPFCPHPRAQPLKLLNLKGSLGIGTTSAGLLSDIAIIVTPSFSGRAHFTALPVSLMVMEAGLTYQARDRAVSARSWMRSPNPVGKPT